MSGDHDSAQEQATYWNSRYAQHKDWDGGIHIGNFDGLSSNASLKEATEHADDGLVSDVLEHCSLFYLITGFRVLEIGCGKGDLAFRLTKVLPRLSYVGFDIAESAVESAKERNLSEKPAESRPLHLEFIVGGVDEVERRRSAGGFCAGFDLIVIREVLYSLSDRERKSLAALCVALLRPAGFVYLLDMFRTNASATDRLQSHLYDRHKSTGSQLALDSDCPTLEEGFRRWAKSWLGEEFRLTDLTTDSSNIARSYDAALSLQTTTSPNSDAYGCLRDLALSSDAGKRPSLTYAKAFFLRTQQLDLGDDAYRFCTRARIYDGLGANCAFGARRGAWNLIIGRSGAGKTTFLRALVGEFLDSLAPGADLIEPREHFFLAQQTELFDHLSPCENVQLYGGDRLEAVGLLRQLGLNGDELADRRSARLSIGQRQRVAIAQCFASRASTIVLDEPMHGLDAARRPLLFELFADIAQRVPGQPLTLICVDHDFETIYRRFDFVFEIIKGMQICVWSKTPG